MEAGGVGYSGGEAAQLCSEGRSHCELSPSAWCLRREATAMPVAGQVGPRGAYGDQRPQLIRHLFPHESQSH